MYSSNPYDYIVHESDHTESVNTDFRPVLTALNVSVLVRFSPIGVDLR